MLKLRISLKQQQDMPAHDNSGGVWRPAVGVVTSGGGMSTRKRPLLPSGKLSRHEKTGIALGHHTMRLNALPDLVGGGGGGGKGDPYHNYPQATPFPECQICSASCSTRRRQKVYGNIDPVFRGLRLANQLRRENTDVVGANRCRMIQGRCQ